MAGGRFKNIHVYLLAVSAYFGIILFGYDTGVAGGVVAQKAFADNFGLTGTSKAHQDAIASNVVSVLQGGAFFGAIFSTPSSAYLGRRWTLVIFTLIFCVGAILTTVAGPGTKGLNEIYIGRVISGLGIGGISAVAPTYVSECCPKDVRGRITGLFQCFVALGVMLSYWVNYGVQQHIPEGPKVWRIPFGLQLVPAGVMLVGLFFTKESPRWLLMADKPELALKNLTFLRRATPEDPELRAEFAEMEAAVYEERNSRVGLGLKEAVFGPGNFIRFVIAVTFFILQQFSGQNSVNYYAPQIFQSIGYGSTSAKLLASGVYGIVKFVATCLFIFFLVDHLGGRRWSLFVSSLGMGTLFFIVGALLKSYPPDIHAENPAPASKAMAALIYIYVVFYSCGWGPIPWVYVSDIFPNRTRHIGLAVASSTQWLFNFVISKITPTIVTNLGWKLFMMFATINIGGMAVFAFMLPETKGRSLEEMDIIFGSVSKETRERDVQRMENEIAHGNTHIDGLATPDSSSVGDAEKGYEADHRERTSRDA